MAIALLRRSTEDEKRQIASLERQRAEIDACAQVPIQKWWTEEGSGTRQQRDTIDELLAWCAVNQRPKAEPGKMYVWEWSRFARPVYVNAGKMVADALAGVHLMGEFWSLGWLIVDVRFGEQEGVINLLLAALGMEHAGSESATLSQRVRSGKRYKHSEGWHQGTAPWPCIRVDADTGAPIPDGHHASQRRIILAADPTKLQQWCFLANRLLAGATYAELADYLNRNGIAGSRGTRGRWNHQRVRQALTNIKLIGYQQQKSSGTRALGTFEPVLNAPLLKAKWGPLVSVRLFSEVVAEVRRREGIATRVFSRRSAYLLKAICGMCGAAFQGNSSRRRVVDGAEARDRYYTHPRLGPPTTPESRERMRVAGCGVQLCIRADQLEAAVLNAIVSTRGSAEYRAWLGLLDSDSQDVLATEARIDRLRGENAALTKEYASAAKAHMLASEQGLPDQPYMDRLHEIARRQQAITIELEAESEDRRRFADREGGLRHQMDLLDRVAQNPDQAPVEEKTELIRQWLARMSISSELIGKNRRQYRHTVLIELRILPIAAGSDQIGEMEPRESRGEGDSSSGGGGVPTHITIHLLTGVRSPSYEP